MSMNIHPPSLLARVPKLTQVCSMKSISAKFLLLITGCLFLTCAVVGGAGIYTSREVISQASTTIMNLLCLKEAQALNARLAYVEQSVTTLAMYTEVQAIESKDRHDQPRYVEHLITTIETAGINIARSTDAAMSIFFRLNPEYFGPKAGFFYTKTAEGLTRNEPTDLSLYAPEDAGHVGWYYIPVDKKKPTWMNPYLNKNTNTWMISYVIPVYSSDILLGVVGMDMDYNAITTTVEQTKVYQTGYAFLATSDGRVVSHKDMPMHTVLSPNPDSELNGLVSRLLSRSDTGTLFNYRYKGEHKRMTFQDLHNGLKFVLTAPEKEIDDKSDQLITQIALFSVIILVIAIVLTYVATTRLVQPLHELNAAARKIASGDLTVDISHKSGDEIGALAESFRQTTCKLRQYISHINALAYKDALTGCKNSAAYIEIQSRLNEQIQSGTANFAVLIFDVNDLKTVNDTRGHLFGDVIIVAAAKAICSVFKHSPVFRIGGDEFAVVLEGADLLNDVQLQENLTTTIDGWNQENRSQNLHLSIAWGLANYDILRDSTMQDVCKRADNIMYQNKASIKQERVQQVWNTDMPSTMPTATVVAAQALSDDGMVPELTPPSTNSAFADGGCTCASCSLEEPVAVEPANADSTPSDPTSSSHHLRAKP